MCVTQNINKSVENGPIEKFVLYSGHDTTHESRSVHCYGGRLVPNLTSTKLCVETVSI